jgi:hypothetical protein
LGNAILFLGALSFSWDNEHRGCSLQEMPLKRRAPKRRGVPEPERLAVAAEIASLLKQRDRMGRRVWTQASIGEACGGLSQQMIFVAQDPDGVGPNVRDGVLRLTGLSIAQLLRKHGISPEEPPVARVYEPAPVPAASAEAGRGDPQAAEGMSSLRRVIRALQEDGYEPAAVKLAVAELVFGDDALERVSRRRLARAKERAGKRKGSWTEAGRTGARRKPLHGNKK